MSYNSPFMAKWDNREWEVISINYNVPQTVTIGDGVGIIEDFKIPRKECLLFRYTGVNDRDGKGIYEKDRVGFLPIKRIGTVVINSGAFGIQFKNPIDWTLVKEELLKGRNRNRLCKNENFISFYEIHESFGDYHTLVKMGGVSF